MTKLDKPARLTRQAEAKSAKRSRRRDELADAAIDALGQLGYARTGLRDIAELSGVAVGTLHYYFDDKVDLIGYCIRRYKAGFVAEMETVLMAGGDPGQVAERLVKALALSIRRDAGTHRLWYDIRGQALFDPAFGAVVDEIEAALLGLAARLFDLLDLPQEGAFAAYLMLDAAFRYHLQRFLAGDREAPAAFERFATAQIGALITAAERG